MKVIKSIKIEPKLIARLNKERKWFKPVPSLHAYMLIKLSKPC